MKNVLLRNLSERPLLCTTIALSCIINKPLTIFATPLSSHIMMQESIVKGTIVDASNEPIVGASIAEKGTTNGTVSDIDGNFSLNVSSPNAIFVISYIGYKTVEIDSSDTNLQKIVLQEDSEILSEVVVVGYGTQKKESLTGAVTVVGAKSFKERGSLSSPLQALQGQVPGNTNVLIYNQLFGILFVFFVKFFDFI